MKNRVLVPAVFFGTAAPLVYALLVRLLLAWFAEARSGLLLAALVYVPPAAALLLLGLGFSLSSSMMLGVEGWDRVARLLLRSYLAVAVLCVLGLVVAAPSLGATRLSVYSFIVSTGFVSIAYAVAAAVWFLLVLPAVPLTAAYRSGPRRLSRVLRVHGAGIAARWLLSLLVAGWAAALLRLVLLSAAAPLGSRLLGFSTLSWTVLRLEEALLPRLADLVVAPFWLSLVSVVYSRLVGILLYDL